MVGGSLPGAGHPVEKKSSDSATVKEEVFLPGAAGRGRAEKRDGSQTMDQGISRETTKE